MSVYVYGVTPGVKDMIRRKSTKMVYGVNWGTRRPFIPKPEKEVIMDIEYDYEGLDKNGKEATGSVFAKDEAEAIKKIHDNHIYPLKIFPVGSPLTKIMMTPKDEEKLLEEITWASLEHDETKRKKAINDLIKIPKESKMKFFNYEVYDQEDGMSLGTMEALSLIAAVEKLKNDKISILSISEQKEVIVEIEDVEFEIEDVDLINHQFPDLQTELPEGMELCGIAYVILKKMEANGSVYFQADDSASMYNALGQLYEITEEYDLHLIRLGRQGEGCYEIKSNEDIGSGEYILVDPESIEIDQDLI